MNNFKKVGNGFDTRESPKFHLLTVDFNLPRSDTVDMHLMPRVAHGFAWSQVTKGSGGMFVLRAGDAISELLNDFAAQIGVVKMPRNGVLQALLTFSVRSDGMVPLHQLL